MEEKEAPSTPKGRSILGESLMFKENPCLFGRSARILPAYFSVPVFIESVKMLPAQNRELPEL